MQGKDGVSARTPSVSVSPQSDNNFTSRDFGAKSYDLPRCDIRGNFVPPIRPNGRNASNVIS